MKKTQVYELKSNIRATVTSFISLTMFVLLGFGIFLGFLWSGDGLNASLDRGYGAGQMHDLEATFTYPVDRSELETILQAEDVADAEGCYICYEHFSFENQRYLARFASLTERIDTPVSYEGVLPTAQNEIAVESGTAGKLGIGIGDKITLVRDDASNAKILRRMTDENSEELDNDELTAMTDEEVCYFYETEMTVTAVIVSPCYVSTSPLSYGMSPKDQIQLSGVFYLPLSSFRTDVVTGYNRFLICSDSLQGMSTFDADYQEKAEAFTESLRPALEQIGGDRYRLVGKQADQFCQTLSDRIAESQAKVDKAKQEIAGNQKKLDDKKAEYEKAKTKLADAEAQLESKKAEIQKAEAKLANAKTQLEEKNAEIQKAESALAEANTKLAELQATVDELNEQVDVIWQTFSGLSQSTWMNDPKIRAVFDAQKTAVSARDTLNAEIQTQSAALKDGKAAYATAQAEYKANVSKLDDGKKAISDAENQIAEAKTAEKALNEAQGKLTTAKADLADAEKSLDTAGSIYEDLSEARDHIKDYGTSCICRSNNAAYFYIDLLSNIIRKLKNSLGGLFLVIGLMICYSVVIRLVNDQKKLIGTKKALGFTTFEILKPYLIYAGSAVTIGALLGGVLAFLLIEPVMTGVLSQTFTLEMVTDYFDFRDFATLFGFEFLLIEIITTLGCLRILKQPAVALLNGSDDVKVRKHHHKKHWMDRLPIFTQTIINNCFHDRRRFLATVIGVSSCVMLLVASITCRNNVLQGETTQYSDYFLFDQFVCYDSGIGSAEEEIETVLQEMEIPYTKAFRTYGYLSGDAFSEKMTAIMVYEDAEDFERMIQIASSDTDAPYTGSGIWVPQSISETYRNENHFALRTLEDAETDLTVTGFFRNYVYNLTVFMDTDSYQKTFGKTEKTNIFIIQSAGCNLAELNEKLQQTEGFVQLQNYYDASRRDAAVFSLVANVFVGVYALMSVVMAFFVLLNLFTTFVEEKKKELIVLMINGFSLHQAHRYIYADTIFLAIIGILVGLGGGIFFGRLAIASFESEYVHLIHSVNPPAFVIGIAVTCLLTAAMTAIALRRIKKFQLEDINKS